MNIKMKKRITAAAGIMLCAVMAGLLWHSLEAPPEKDEPLTAAGSTESSVTVSAGAIAEGESLQSGAAPVIQTPDIQAGGISGASGGSAAAGAVSEGTEQTIQGDPQKPQYSEAELTDPDTAPDGTPAGQTQKEQDAVIIPPPEELHSSGGLPGFGNVPDGGSNQAVNAADMYENGNKIGIMD